MKQKGYDTVSVKNALNDMKKKNKIVKTKNGKMFDIKSYLIPVEQQIKKDILTILSSEIVQESKLRQQMTEKHPVQDSKVVKKVIKYIEQESKLSDNPIIRDKIGHKDYIFYSRYKTDFDSLRQVFFQAYERFRMMFSMSDKVPLETVNQEIPEKFSYKDFQKYHNQQNIDYKLEIEYDEKDKKRQILVKNRNDNKEEYELINWFLNQKQYAYNVGGFIQQLHANKKYKQFVDVCKTFKV